MPGFDFGSPTLFAPLKAGVTVLAGRGDAGSSASSNGIVSSPAGNGAAVLLLEVSARANIGVKAPVPGAAGSARDR